MGDVRITTPEVESFSNSTVVVASTSSFSATFSNTAVCFGELTVELSVWDGVGLLDGGGGATLAGTGFRRSMVECDGEELDDVLLVLVAEALFFICFSVERPPIFFLLDRGLLLGGGGAGLATLLPELRGVPPCNDRDGEDFSEEVPVSLLLAAPPLIMASRSRSIDDFSASPSTTKGGNLLIALGESLGVAE